MPKKFKLAYLWFFLLFAVLSGVIAFFTANYFNQKPLTSPIDQQTNFQFIRRYLPRKKPYVVYGFLPYWNLSKFQLNDSLTHLAYFRLAINKDGSIKFKEDRQVDPGYSKLQSDAFLDIINQLEKNKVKLEIVFTIFKDETAKEFLTSDKAQAEFFKNLDSVLLAYPVTGINLDVELTNTGGSQLKADLTRFVTKLKKYLDKKPEKVALSIDVYPSAALKENIWDLPQLANLVDHVVIMTYDFHRSQSTQAGPVAPLIGGGSTFASDVHQYLIELIKQVPAEKVLLGVAFYGYQWQTVDHSPQAKTYPDSGKAVPYTDVVKLLNQKGVKRNWNSRGLSPYLTYTENGKNYILYYEDKNSLHYKLELVNQLNLGGIAIWALGYEGGTQELWQEIKNML